MTDFASIAAELAPQSQGAKGGSSFSDIASELKGGHLKNSGFSANGIPVDPNADITPTPEKPRGWWEKYLGAKEAEMATITGATLGPIGGAAAVGGRVLNNVKDLIMGRRPDGNLEEAYAKGQEALTYSPRTAAGQEYTKNVSDALNDSGLMAIAPLAHVQSLAGTAPGIKTAPAVAADAGEAVPKPNFGALLEKASPETKASVAQAQAKGLPINEQVLAKHLEADTLPVPIRLTKGQATGDVNQISFEQNNRGKNPELAARFNEQNGELIKNMDAIRAKAAPDVTAVNHVENGQALIDAYKNFDAPIKADISAKYQALKDANGGQFPLNGRDFVKAADQALKNDNVTRFIPPEVRGLLDDLRESGAMNFNDFENYRTILAAQARKFARSGDGTAEHAVNTVRDALESLPMSDEAAEIKPLADAARSAAKARFDAIKKDPAYKAAISDGIEVGEQSPLADKFIENYVVNGKRANVQSMVNNLGNDSLAKQTISAGVLDYLKHSSGVDLRTNTGNVSQSGYNKALTKISPKNDLLFDPEIAQNTQQLGNVARYIQEQPRGSYVNNSNTFAAMAAEKAAWGAEQLANAKLFGLGTGVRSFIDRRKVSNAVKDSLSPGAGMTRLSEIAKEGAKP